MTVTWREILFFLILFGANLIQAITGFAGTLLAMPPSMQLLGVDEAKSVLAVLDQLSCLLIVLTGFRHINWKEFGKMAVLMVVGMFVGMRIFEAFPIQQLLTLYGAMILCIALWKLFGQNLVKKTNPASIVSEACRKLRPNARIINICDMPIAIIDVVAAALEVNKKDLVYDYYGLNHFGWFTSIEYKGEDVMPKLRDYIMDQEILLPAAYLKDKGVLTSSGSGGNRHTKGSWYYVWKGVYEIMKNFPETLPNTYLNYYLQQKEFVEHSDPNHTRANEVMETREKNLFDGIDRYLATGEIDESVFYAGSHGDWIADLAIALKNDTKARFLVITENRGAIPNMPYDAMVEVPAYIGKKGPEVIAQNEIPLFQQGLMMQQLNSEKLLVEGCIEGSYEKVLKAFTLNKTVPSMKVAKEILDDMIEANKGYWPELK